MPTQVINLNGKIFGPTEIDQAKVPVFDRSYLYGDSLYEVVRTYQGRPFLVQEHLSRLERSAQLCKIQLPRPLSYYAEEIEKTIRHFLEQPENQSLEVYCRLVVSRGEGKIGFSQSLVANPGSFSIICQKLNEPDKAAFEKGASLQVSARLRNDPRALDPAAKTGNYLNNVLAFLDAEKAGYQEAILCNSEGHITEGTVFNIFYVNRGIVATSPLNIGILGGISRDFLIEIMREKNIPFREVRFPKEYMYQADEVFMTSTTKEVFPVVALDNVRIGNGKPGPMTRRLKKEFNEKALNSGS